jgi:NADH-ubiquinone oxidoreductase chain 6
LISSFLLILSLNTACFFIFINHPLAIGLVLLVQTCIIAFLTGCLRSCFWFSYILFLVFLGGILVLFIYMTRLASNEIFSISSVIITFFPFIMVGFVAYALVSQLFDYFSPTSTHSHFLDRILKQRETYTLVLKLYRNYGSHLTILLACYLFLTLVVVVIVTNISNGPLRTHF